MNQESVPMNETSAAANILLPRDRALDALATGKRVFKSMRGALTENRIYDVPEIAEAFVDDTAQELAQDLVRYLSSCPPELRVMLAGEVFRSLLFESEARGFYWEPEPLVPMTKHAEDPGSC